MSKYNINIIDFNYVDVFRTEIKEFSFQALNLRQVASLPSNVFHASSQ